METITLNFLSGALSNCCAGQSCSAPSPRCQAADARPSRLRPRGLPGGLPRLKWSTMPHRPHTEGRLVARWFWRGCAGLALPGRECGPTEGVISCGHFAVSGTAVGDHPGGVDPGGIDQGGPRDRGDPLRLLPRLDRYGSVHQPVPRLDSGDHQLDQLLSGCAEGTAGVCGPGRPRAVRGRHRAALCCAAPVNPVIPVGDALYVPGAPRGACIPYIPRVLCVEHGFRSLYSVEVRRTPLRYDTCGRPTLRHSADATLPGRLSKRLRPGEGMDPSPGLRRMERATGIEPA